MTKNIPEEDKIINDKLKELEENKDYKDIKEKLDKGNNFIDYFLIIGLEPNIYKKDWLFKEDLKTINEKHKEEITPKIISCPSVARRMGDAICKPINSTLEDIFIR